MAARARAKETHIKSWQEKQSVSGRNAVAVAPAPASPNAMATKLCVYIYVWRKAKQPIKSSFEIVWYLNRLIKIFLRCFAVHFVCQLKQMCVCVCAVRYLECLDRFTLCPWPLGAAPRETSPSPITEEPKMPSEACMGRCMCALLCRFLESHKGTRREWETMSKQAAN